MSNRYFYEAPFSIAQQPALFEIDRLPVASDVLAFLQQVLKPAAGRLLNSVIHFAHNLPVTSGNILEVHFDKEVNNVDFAARLNTSFDKQIIGELFYGDYSFPIMAGGFPSLFDEDGSGFVYGIENIWAEYDAPFTGPPALFFDLHSGKSFHVKEAFKALCCLAKALTYQLDENVLACLEKVQGCGLHVVYYGLMFSRTNPSLRLTINGVNADNLTNILAALGWNGNGEAIQRLTSTYLDKSQNLVLGIDAAKHISSRIGIEVFDRNQSAFANTLHCNGHINEEQLEMLASWEQRFVLPKRLRNALSELHGRDVHELHTRINHFKFVLDDTENIKTKGYLYYCF